MSIKINARETNVKIGKNPGFYYVMTGLIKSRRIVFTPSLDAKELAFNVF
jgi:hypothetical protein